MLGLLRQIIPALIDILLIALLFYRGYLLVLGTRLAQLGHLIALGVGAVFLADVLGLYTVAWLVERVWIWGIVLLIVLFQVELKQMITRLGYRSRFFGGSPAEMRRFVGDMVVFVMRLGARKQGALLVIERDDALDEIANSGVRLEARFCYEMLLAIYAESSPLRDGAVLLRNRRIHAASCLLPIPDPEQQQGSSLGLRHLAAITLSRMTDAVIVVISGETGVISLAVNGRWRRKLNQPTLEEALTDYLILGVDRGEDSR